MHLFWFIGPPLPKTLMDHEMVQAGLDLIVLGGTDYGFSSDDLYKLSCSRNICKWETLPQKWKVPRYSFVAIPVPDDFITCD